MKIGFLLFVYDEWDLAWRTLIDLQATHPSAVITCCTDGTWNEDFVDFCRVRSIEFVRGIRCKPLHNGAKWIRRMLWLMARQTDCDLHVRIEPDTKILRPLHSFPFEAGIAGTLVETNWLCYVNGACTGITPLAVKLLRESRIFCSDSFKSSVFGYQRYASPFLQSWEVRSDEWFLASDLALAYGAQEVGIKLANWPECNCYTLAGDLEGSLEGLTDQEIAHRWAAIHPVKHL